MKSKKFSKSKNYIYQNWKLYLNIEQVNEHSIFYNEMFNCKSEEELFEVFKKFYYISKPFDELYMENDNDLSSLKSVIITSTAFTYKEAVLRGINPVLGINMLMEYNTQIFEAETYSKLLDIRTAMMVDFYYGVVNKNNSDDTLLIRKIKDYISKHIHEKILISNIADCLGYNKDYISHSFKMLTGIGINHYIHQLRMDEAKMLLINTNDSVLEIAEYLGYSSAGSFVRRFKTVTGITTTEYRRTNYR